MKEYNLVYTLTGEVIYKNTITGDSITGDRLFGGDAKEEEPWRHHYSYNAAVEIALENGAGIILDLSGAEGLTKIDAEAFKDCATLTEIILPDSLAEVEENAFKGCLKMTVNYAGSKAQWKKVKIAKAGNNALRNGKLVYDYAQ